MKVGQNERLTQDEKMFLKKIRNQKLIDYKQKAIEMYGGNKN